MAVVSASELERPQEQPLANSVATNDTNRNLRTQAVRFVLSGGLSAVVDFGLLLALLRVDMPFAAAKTISFVAGTSIAYMINRRWTFQAPPSRTRFLAVAALYSVMFVVQVGISTGLHTVLPSGAIWVLVAFVCAQSVATIVNFVVQRRVIFKLD
ncbi:GtrA family protein [Rhodococcus jostii]|uniref:GtrA family protein n=1 Tax=Rhodococcus jostii TaxID=132919 RepID=UPI0036265BFF